MSYGVVSTGFSRKPLPTTLAEIEASLITEFGPQVVQTSQSPLGQINGLMADLITQLWEIAEDVYQSYDPDQAEGTRLDSLAKMRLLRRGTGETEIAFRQAITNQGQARIDVQDIIRALRSIPGVTYAQVFFNDPENPNSQIPPGFICAAVIGGDDENIAEVLRQYVVPGISTYGNMNVSTIVDGFCRNMTVLRPIPVPVTMIVQIRTRNDNAGCPAPSNLAIKNALVAALKTELVNGDDITHFRIRSIIERLFNNVEVVSISASRDGLIPLPTVEIGFPEIATVALDDVTMVSL